MTRTSENRLMTGQRLREIREALGLSQHQMAVRIGLPRLSGARCLSQWERGANRVPGPVALALALIFGEVEPPPALAVTALRRIAGGIGAIKQGDLALVRAALSEAEALARPETVKRVRETAKAARAERLAAAEEPAKTGSEP